jgi:hypothetical protein
MLLEIFSRRMAATIGEVDLRFAGASRIRNRVLELFRWNERSDRERSDSSPRSNLGIFHFFCVRKHEYELDIRERVGLVS